CPQCHGPLNNAPECPRCGPVKAPATGRWHLDLGRGQAQPAEKWQQSPGGRTILGTLLALGLCYGLLQVGMACLRALGVDAASGALDPLTGLILFQGLQVLALLGGGMLAGAGQERGSVLGGIVGILSGVVILAAMLSGLVSTLVQSYS